MLLAMGRASFFLQHLSNRRILRYRTAMSMVDFYINRAGANPSAADKAKLEQIKGALRQAFGRYALPA
jgi:hypothetical protein